MSNNLRVACWARKGGAICFACDLCGERYQLSHLTVVLVEGEDDRRDVVAIGICPSCLDSGLDGAVERILANVGDLRDQTLALEALAEGIRTMQPHNWATTQELERALAAGVRDRRFTSRSVC